MLSLCAVSSLARYSNRRVAELTGDEPRAQTRRAARSTSPVGSGLKLERGVHPAGTPPVSSRVNISLAPRVTTTFMRSLLEQSARQMVHISLCDRSSYQEVIKKERIGTSNSSPDSSPTQ